MALNPALFMNNSNQAAAYYNDPRLKYYNKLIENGSSTAPVPNAVAGIARALQAGLGGYMNAQLGNEYKDNADQTNAATGRILDAQPLPWSTDQSQVHAMANAAKIENQSNPLVAPLTQQLAFADADPAKQEKEMQLRIMKTLLGGAGDVAPGGTPPTASAAGVAPSPVAPAGAPNTSGINAPMTLPAGGGAPTAALPPAATNPAGTLDINSIATDPKKAAMMSTVFPKVVEGAQNALKLQNELNPLPAELQKKTAAKAADQVALNQEIQSKGALALQAVSRMRQVNETAPEGDTAGLQAFGSRNAAALGMGDGQKAKDYRELNQLSGLIKAMDIKPLFQGTGQIRVAELKMLNDIENIDPNMSAPERKQLLDNVQNLLENQMRMSQQRAVSLSTPGKSLDANFTAAPFKDSNAPAAAPAAGDGGGKTVNWVVQNGKLVPSQ